MLLVDLEHIYDVIQLLLHTRLVLHLLQFFRRRSDFVGLVLVLLLGDLVEFLGLASHLFVQLHGKGV